MKKVSPLLLFFVVFLLPLVPVVVLYRLFGEANYFGFDGWAKGVTASGPVALYVFLIYFGLRFIRWYVDNVDSTQVDSRFFGVWAMESRTEDKSAHRLSSVKVEWDAGVKLSGDWADEDGNHIGSWSSRCVDVKGTEFHFTYVLSGVPGPDSYHGTAYGVLVDDQSIAGKWYLIDDATSGSFQMKKMEGDS